MTNAWHIKGGRILDPTAGRDEKGDICVADGVLVPFDRAFSSCDPGVIDAEGLVVAPGLLDLHAHLREPGDESSETMASGARAAARGGFTTIVCMPNTEPPADTPERVAWLVRRADGVCDATLLPAGCITRGRAGADLADLRGMAVAGAVAFTDDGSTPADEEVMRAAAALAAEADVVIMDHAAAPALSRGVMHEGRISRTAGLPGIPSGAETSMVERDIRLAEATGGAVHIQHVSCGESARMIRRAREQGLRVSGEATPHHLALTDADVDIGDARFKMNPPLREAADRRALREAVADGTLQALATDHAPHGIEAKSKGFRDAPFGVVGLETAVGVTYTELVVSGLMNVASWLERWTVGPWKVLGRKPPGLAPGETADLVILDLSSRWTVRPEEFLSKSRNTPFEGRCLKGRPVYTFCRGRLSWGSERA